MTVAAACYPNEISAWLRLREFEAGEKVCFKAVKCFTLFRLEQTEYCSVSLFMSFDNFPKIVEGCDKKYKSGTLGCNGAINETDVVGGAAKLAVYASKHLQGSFSVHMIWNYIFAG